MKSVKSLSKMLTSFLFRRASSLNRAERARIVKSNNVHYRRACETAIKGLRNADSMISQGQLKAAQAQLRFALHATAEFVSRVNGEVE